MPLGFVLITSAPAKEHIVHSKLSGVDDIVELQVLFGEYDLLAKIETDNFDQLGQIVMDKIRVIDGVIDTKTLTGTTL